MDVDIWVAVLAGLLGGGFGLAGGWQGRRNEHKQWRRDSRRAAYLAFLNSADKALSYSTESYGEVADEDRDVEIHRLLTTNEAAARDVMLVGPGYLLNAAQELHEELAALVWVPPQDREIRVDEHRNRVATFASGGRRALKTGR